MHAKLVSCLIGASLITATGCATPSGQGAAVGAAGGGLVGAAVGGRTGLLVGAALGGLFGYGVGRAIEIEDQREVAYALEYDRAVRWENPDTGYRYQVEPTRTFVQRGRECRDFRMLAEVDGQPQEVYGTACRRGDGSWEVLSG